MNRESPDNKAGFTLVEILITLTIALILIAALGAVITDGWTAWYRLKDRFSCEVFDDSYVVRRFFDAAIRKSSGNLSVDSSGLYIKAYYYENDASTFLDRYVRLFVADRRLNAEYGQIDSEGLESTILVRTICWNVSSGIFSVAGRSAQMKLDLDDGKYRYVVVSSAVAHN